MKLMVNLALVLVSSINSGGTSERGTHRKRNKKQKRHEEHKALFLQPD